MKMNFLFWSAELLSLICLIFAESNVTDIANITDSSVATSESTTISSTTPSLNLSSANSIIWQSESYPNPLLKENIQKCNIQNSTFLCDPDEVLTSEARQNVIEALERMNDRNSSIECKYQGIIGGIVLAKKFSGGKPQTLKTHARDLLKKWKMDEECQKSLIIAMAVEDHSFWISKDPKVGISSHDLKKYFNDQKQLLQQQNYEQALINVIRQISLNNNRMKNPGNQEIDWNQIAIIAFVIILICCIICVICCLSFCSCCCCGGSGGGEGGCDTTNNAGNNNWGSSDAEGGGGDW